MGDISSNFNVQKEIGYMDFLAEVKNQKTNIKNEQEAASIFNRYDTNNDGILSEEEQIKVREEYLEKMDADRNEKLSKKEFKKGKSETTGNNYDAYRVFNQTLDNITAESGKTVVKQSENNAVEVEGHKTDDVTDDKVNGESVIKQPEPQPEPKEPEFKDKDAVELIVYQYLLGSDFTEDDLKNLKGKDNLPSVDIGDIPEDGADEVNITYDGKTYVLRKSGENYSIDEKQEDGAEGTPKTLQQAILDSGSTDTKHAYRNRHGSVGNSQSTYNREEGRIDNKSNKRRHVNPAQTFAKMLMNNDEGSTLTVDKGLSGADVIQVIKGDSGDGITMHDLMKYLSATLLEEKATTAEGLNYGVRSPAGDADMDLKDMANIGIIFRKYDTDKDNKLNAAELDKLINDLKTKSMTTLAKGATDVHHTADETTQTQGTTVDNKPEPPKTESQSDEFKPQYGAAATANRTRKRADNKSQQVEYRYENGTRSVIEDGKVVTNANVAKYQDHGLFGWGKKDFIYIEGLEAGVSAEVVDPKHHNVKGNQTIKIKKRGNEKVSEYYEVTYENGKYKLGANMIMVHLFGDANKGKYTEIPNGLTLEYKKGKPVYKLNGNIISEERARAHVIAANAKINPEEK